MEERKFVVAMLQDETWYFYKEGNWTEDVNEANLFNKETALPLCEELFKCNPNVVVFSSRLFGL
ncbi:MAG: hypothetical protein GX088_04225 [Clostridia bacterium]|nr:hypothetical protein [Clostridia bacterium]